MTIIDIVVKFCEFISNFVFEKKLARFTKKFYSYTKEGCCSASLENLMSSGYSEKKVRKYIYAMFKKEYLINASSFDREAWLLNSSGLGYYRSL